MKPTHAYAIGGRLPVDACARWSVAVDAAPYGWLCLGIIGTREGGLGLQTASHSHPSSFGWGCDSGVWIRGRNIQGHGGWPTWFVGDKATFSFDPIQVRESSVLIS